jgi:transporter family protein
MKYMWIVFALLAALSAGVVVSLSKAGIKTVDPSLGFAIEAVLILLVSWTVVLVQGNWSALARIDTRSWIFLIVAGVITTLSSLFSFHALKLGNASMVNPLQNLSLVFAVLFAVLFLKEKITWQAATGVLLMAAGAVLIALSGKR